METPTQLASDSLHMILIKCPVKDALNDARRYVPRDVLESSITPASVKAALKRLSPSRKFWKVPTKSTVEIVCSKGLKKLFVILLHLNVPWDVKKLYDAGFTDADLPAERKETKHGDVLQSGLDPQKSFTPPKQWGFNLVEDFVNKQWMVMAPMFSSTGQHKELDSKCPLPLIEAEALIHSPQNIVYKAKIEASHQEGFKVETLNLDIAIKEFLNNFNSAFEQERDNLNAIRKLPQSVHINQSLATFRQGSSAYIISPWAGGGDLDNFWTAKNVKKRTAELTLWSLQQMLGLSEALFALHEKLGDAANCRHGDLKPGNILHFQVGSGEGILKIADFGISRVHQEATFDRLGPTTTGASSPSYEAPETTDSLNPRSRKYDIWSLGGILLEFVIWLVQDASAIQRFKDARVSKSAATTGPMPSHFYYKIDDGTMIVHPEVLDAIANLQKLPRSAPGTALGELLDIIKSDLIQIEADRRVDAKGLCEKLQDIVRKARSNREYLSGS